MEDGCFQELRLSWDKICPISQHGNCRDIPHILNVFFKWKVNFITKSGSPIVKCPFIVLPRNVIIIQHL